MATVAVYNIEGKEVDKLELNDNVFGVEINEHLVHLAVVSQFEILLFLGTITAFLHEKV